MENNDFQRIKRVMQVKEIPSFAAFSRQIGLPTPQNFTDLKRGKYKITRNFASKIHDVYPDISIAWLMTGEGSMLAGSANHHNAVASDHSTATVTHAENGDLTSIVASQQATIAKQADTIATLAAKI